MNKALMQMSIDVIYEIIRSTYYKFNKNKALCMSFLPVFQHTIYNAINALNPQTRVYEAKLKEEHKTYIHPRMIENPQISGETLAHDIYEFLGLKVSDITIYNYKNKILIFKQPISSVFISELASQKRFFLTKYHIENNTNFLNTILTDESNFFLG